MFGPLLLKGQNDNKKWDLLADCRSGIAGTEYVKELNGVYRYIKLTILDAKSKSRAGSRSLVIKGFGSPRNATWWEETSGMTRYYPKYYRQTLNSIKDSLDILQAQGYRNIELSAIYEGDPSVWGGLGATNNYAIDPSIGTLEDFEDLLREVHARDMRLTFFGNVGYCWYKAPFFEKACDDQRNGVYSKERNWFHFSDKKLNDNWFWSDRARLITIRVGETRMGLKDAFQATTLTIGSGRKSVGIIWTFGQIRGWMEYFWMLLRSMMVLLTILSMSLIIKVFKS